MKPGFKGVPGARSRRPQRTRGSSTKRPMKLKPSPPPGSRRTSDRPTAAAMHPTKDAPTEHPATSTNATFGITAAHARFFPRGTQFLPPGSRDVLHRAAGSLGPVVRGLQRRGKRVQDDYPDNSERRHLQVDASAPRRTSPPGAHVHGGRRRAERLRSRETVRLVGSPSRPTADTLEPSRAKS